MAFAGMSSNRKMILRSGKNARNRKKCHHLRYAAEKIELLWALIFVAVLVVSIEDRH